MKKIGLSLAIAGLVGCGFWIWRHRSSIAKKLRVSSRRDRVKGTALKMKHQLTADPRDQLRGNLLADRAEVKDWLIAVKCDSK